MSELPLQRSGANPSVRARFSGGTTPTRARSLTVVDAGRAEVRYNRAARQPPRASSPIRRPASAGRISNHRSHYHDDDMLTVADAARLARRSVRTLRRAYLSGRMIAHRDGNGRGVSIRYGDLRAWLTAEVIARAPAVAPSRAIAQHQRPREGRRRRHDTGIRSCSPQRSSDAGSAPAVRVRGRGRRAADSTTVSGSRRRPSAWREVHRRRLRGPGHDGTPERASRMQAYARPGGVRSSPGARQRRRRGRAGGAAPRAAGRAACRPARTASSPPACAPACTPPRGRSAGHCGSGRSHARSSAAGSGRRGRRRRPARAGSCRPSSSRAWNAARSRSRCGAARRRSGRRSSRRCRAPWPPPCAPGATPWPSSACSDRPTTRPGSRPRTRAAPPWRGPERRARCPAARRSAPPAPRGRPSGARRRWAAAAPRRAGLEPDLDVRLLAELVLDGLQLDRCSRTSAQVADTSHSDGRAATVKPIAATSAASRIGPSGSRCGRLRTASMIRSTATGRRRGSGGGA